MGLFNGSVVVPALLYCEITISDVLLRVTGEILISGALIGKAYVTWTSTASPGALQVPDAQVVQVVG